MVEERRDATHTPQMNQIRLRRVLLGSSRPEEIEINAPSEEGDGTKGAADGDHSAAETLNARAGRGMGRGREGRAGRGGRA